MGLFAEPKLRERRFWIAVSERSYSIYLLHMLVSFVILEALRPQVPLPLALLAAIAGTFAVVEISYRLVERPSHRLARKLSRREKTRPIPDGADIGPVRNLATTVTEAIATLGSQAEQAEAASRRTT